MSNTPAINRQPSIDSHAVQDNRGDILGAAGSITSLGKSMKEIIRACLLACVGLAPAVAQNVEGLVGDQLSGLVSTYQGIHAHPELSHREEHTAALLAA